MNSNQKNGGNQSPIEDDLDIIVEAYKDLGHDEPPDLLDQAILNSAHRAVEKQSHWLQFGWLHGLTTAAVVVLAFTIILNQGDPAPRLDETIPLDPVVLPRTENSAGKAPAVMAKRYRAEEKLEVRKMDKDVQSEKLLLEEVMEDIALPAPASVQTASDQAESEQAPSLVAEPENRQMMGMARELTDPEKELETILNLKHAGDDSWKEALALFIEHYPDYPLPEGLMD